MYALDVDASYSATNMYALTCGLPDVGFMKVSVCVYRRHWCDVHYTSHVGHRGPAVQLPCRTSLTWVSPCPVVCHVVEPMWLWVGLCLLHGGVRAVQSQLGSCMAPCLLGALPCQHHSRTTAHGLTTNATQLDAVSRAQSATTPAPLTALPTPTTWLTGEVGGITAGRTPLFVHGFDMAVRPARPWAAKKPCVHPTARPHLPPATLPVLPFLLGFAHQSHPQFRPHKATNSTDSARSARDLPPSAPSRELDMLLIAEDADYHENNFLWSYDVSTVLGEQDKSCFPVRASKLSISVPTSCHACSRCVQTAAMTTCPHPLRPLSQSPCAQIPTGDMTRLISTPYGAEVTGTVFVTLNGATYIFNAMQHPYGDNSWLPLVNATGACKMNMNALRITGR